MISFWLPWLCAFLGFPLGGAAAFFMVGPIDKPWKGAMGGFTAGLVIGLAQWLVLRRTLPLSGLWMVYTAIGMGIGLCLSVALIGKDLSYPKIAARGAITGLFVGISQWVCLHPLAEGSFWWIPCLVAAWSLAWCVTKVFLAAVSKNLLSKDFAVFGASGALFFQGIMGMLLVWLKLA